MSNKISNRKFTLFSCLMKFVRKILDKTLDKFLEMRIEKCV